MSKTSINHWHLLPPAQKKALEKEFSTAVKNALEANFIDRIRGKDEDFAKDLFTKVIEHAPLYSEEVKKAIITNLPAVINQHKDSIKKSGLSEPNMLDALAFSVASKATKEDQEKATTRRFAASSRHWSSEPKPLFPILDRLAKDLENLERDEQGISSTEATPHRVVVPGLDLRKITNFEFDAKENEAKGGQPFAPDAPRTPRSPLSSRSSRSK